MSLAERVSDQLQLRLDQEVRLAAAARQSEDHRGSARACEELARARQAKIASRSSRRGAHRVARRVGLVLRRPEPRTLQEECRRHAVAPMRADITTHGGGVAPGKRAQRPARIAAEC